MPFIWQISILKFKKSTLVIGVILNGNPSAQKKSNSVNTFTTVIASYFKKNYANREIVIAIDGKQHDLITDNNGGFLLELDSRSSNKFEIFPKGSSKPIEAFQSYPVVFNDTSFPLAIISDIDDTILVSHTLNFWKRVGNLLFISPHKRKPISFTQEILNKVSTQNGRIFYVSKSESNLFALLTTFIKKHNLPEGNLTLTPYIRYNHLLSSKKGKDFKERMIKTIISRSPNKRFILIGDDTQKDISVYTDIVKLYPKSIFKVYIRKTQKNLLRKKQQQLDKLMNLNVPVLYFTNSSDLIKEIHLIENHKTPTL